MAISVRLICRCFLSLTHVKDISLRPGTGMLLPVVQACLHPLCSVSALTLTQVYCI